MGKLILSRRAPALSALVAPLLALACGGQAAHSEPPAAPTASDEPQASETLAPPESDATTSEPAAPVGAPASSPETQPPQPSPVELCNQMCDRVKKKCSESATESCRMNCTQYDHPPEGCDAQVRAALECAVGAEDIQCVNIAPESCASEFRRVVACASGKPEGAMPEDPTKIPDDWQRFESSKYGFAAPAPKNIAETTTTPEPTFEATSGDAKYRIRVQAPPKDPPTQKNLVKVGMGLIGKCNKNLKLFSMVERPGRVSIRFSSTCPGNAELNGLISIASGKMIVLEVNAPKGSSAPKDPFFYGFEAK